MIEFRAESGNWMVYASVLDPLLPVPEVSWMITTASSDIPGIDFARYVRVEVLEASSGIAPRVALEGSFESSHEVSGVVRIAVANFGRIDDLERVEYQSNIHTPLVSGLPDEFARITLQSIVSSSQVAQFPSGFLRVSGGGFDELNTSRLAIEKAVGVLLAVLNPTAPERNLDKTLAAVLVTS